MTDTTDASPPIHALLVDGDAEYRAFVGELLQREGITFASADDGESVITRIASGETFDLMLIDCDLPSLNGLQLITRLRRDNLAPMTYAVMLTGREDLETKLAALASGFDDFMVKAATELELAAKIAAAKRLLMRQQGNRESFRQMRDLAFTDALTGLLNRRFFFEEAERIVGSAPGAGLVIFDLDHFKDVNDTHGHLTGDRVLRDVASVLRHHTRLGDFVIRFGGDEFVMMTATVSSVQLEEIAARITREIAAMHWTVGDARIRIGVSAGVATTDLLPNRSVTALLDAADRDLYKNKWIRRTPADPRANYEYERGGDADVTKLEPSARHHRGIERS